EPGERLQAADASRNRIVRAAAALLQSEDAEPFSIDAVAQRAGVSRMTIYNQFGSKGGLLATLFDAIARSGEFGRMGDVFGAQNPIGALDDFVALFGRFWTKRRLTHRRLRAAAIVDEDLALAIERHGDRRRSGLLELVRRLPASYTPAVPVGEVVNVLFVLLSFDSFDAIAGERTPEEVTPVVQAVVRAVVGAGPST
ncbi:MAG: TetR/AcrR family transcriptional regulator, partial [Gemmatimonadaceae bacterium]